jgi:hypothetical protein
MATTGIANRHIATKYFMIFSLRNVVCFFSPELRATRFPRRYSVERRTHARSVALTEKVREKQIFDERQMKRRYFAQATSTVLPTPGT